MSHPESEDGFTLVEVLLAVVISAIIVGGIAGILIVTLESYPRSAARISLSDNAQLLSSYLVPDAQSAAWNAQGIDTGALTNIPGCSATPPPSSSNVVTLTWSQYDSQNVTYVAAYRQVDSELIRYFCKGGVLLNTTTVGRDIAPNGAVATQTVDSVNIAVRTVDLVNGSGSGYNFSVSAIRRTPALRIFPVPELTPSFITDPSSTINGTALPNALVNLTITDQSGHKISLAGISADGRGNWSVRVASIPWNQISLVGLVTFDVSSNASTATTSTMTPFIPLVSALSPSPTNVSPVDFLVTFPEPLAAGTTLCSCHLDATGPHGEELPADPDPWPCQTGAALGSVCFRVQVIGVDTNDDSDDGPVTLVVPADQVHDAAGNQNVASQPYSITWDLNLPIVTPNPPNPTSTAVSFLVRFPYPVVSFHHTDVSLSSNPTPEPAMTPHVAGASCPAPVGTSECFTVNVTGLNTAPGTDTQVSAQVIAGLVTDTKYHGLNSQSAAVDAGHVEHFAHHRRKPWIPKHLLRSSRSGERHDHPLQ